MYDSAGMQRAATARRPAPAKTVNTPSVGRARRARESNKSSESSLNQSPLCRLDTSDPASVFLVLVLLLLKFQTFYGLSQ